MPETQYAAAYPGDVVSSQDTYAQIETYSMTWPTGKSGEVSGLSLTNGGSGYLPTATLSGGGGGSGGQLTPVITNGVVTGVTVAKAGSGYRSVPTVTISRPNGGTGLPRPRSG